MVGWDRTGGIVSQNLCSCGVVATYDSRLGIADGG